MGLPEQGARLDGCLRWYLGRGDVGPDRAKVLAGGGLALVGGDWDDLEGFADRLAPERPVIDLTRSVPSARSLRALYAEHPETIAIARRQERVIGALGVIAQPWYMLAAPLTARPGEAVPLLREAVRQLGVHQPLEALGPDFVAGLEGYLWPRGLHEIRQVSWRLAALLELGSFTGAARRLAVSRQALSKYLNRRLA